METESLRNFTMTTKVTTGNALNMNQERKLHHHARGRIIRLLREQGSWLATSIHRGREPLLQRAKVDAYLTWSANRKQDTANWYPMLKAMVDGFTDARLWPDDNKHHVEGPFPHHDPNGVVPKGMVMVRFEITELPPLEDVTP